MGEIENIEKMGEGMKIVKGRGMERDDMRRGDSWGSGKGDVDEGDSRMKSGG
jgi:hypothetical protein